MPDYQPPSPEVAAFVHDRRAECEEQRQRLRNSSIADAWQIANDTSETEAARLEALLVLVRRKDHRLADLVLALFDDPNSSLWRSPQGRNI